MPLMQRNYMGGRHSVIPRGYQALIPSYRFNCSGNITEWLVGVTSPTVELIEIELQVWRPVNNTGLCFSKVGGNMITVSSVVQVANFTPTEQIQFQSGDVVGFRLLNRSSQIPSPVTEQQRNNNGDGSRDEDEREEDDENEENDGKEGEDGDDDDDDDDDDDGVVILNEVNNITPNEEVWFSRVGNTILGSDLDRECTLSIGSNGILTTFTTAAPLISASVLVTENNLQVPQGVTVSTSVPLELSPITVEEGTGDVLILVSATTVPVILIILVSIIVAVVCTYHWVKRRNKVFSGNHSIPAWNEDAVQRIVVPTVYRREITQNQASVKPGALRIAIIPQTTGGHNRAPQSNRSAEITSREDCDQSTVRASEVNIHTRAKNEPIVMNRNESYGKLECSIADSDAEYYFMYDYPNVY